MVRLVMVVCLLVGTSLMSSAWIQSSEKDQQVNGQVPDEPKEIGNRSLQMATK